MLLTGKKKIKASFFNDRFEKDQVPFTKGKAASVNYSVGTSVIAPRQDSVSGHSNSDADDEEEEEADSSESEKKVHAEKTPMVGEVNED